MKGNRQRKKSAIPQILRFVLFHTHGVVSFALH